MNGDISKIETLLKVQGERVLTFKRMADGTIRENVLTFVHVVDAEARSLRLVNRDEKCRVPDFIVGQRLFDAVRPARSNKLNAKWEVTLKAA